MMHTNRSTANHCRGEDHPWRIGKSTLRFPADRVWVLGPPGYEERLPEAAEFRELSGVVVVLALEADDILGRWESTVETLRVAQSVLVRESLVAVADPAQTPKGVLSMAEKLLQVPLMSFSPPPPPASGVTAIPHPKDPSDDAHSPVVPLPW